MQIALELKADHLLMATPPLDNELSALGRALTSGYPAMALPLDAVYDQFNSQQPATFRVPLAAWRHFLRSLIHGYDTAVKVFGYTGDALEFALGDQRFTTEAVVPELPSRQELVGTFELSSGQLLATDPCYENINDGVVVPALPGRWTARTLLRDERNGYSVALLAVAHESFQGDALDIGGYGGERVGVAGVDSGQCAFFDLARYPRDAGEFTNDDGTFYSRCCEASQCESDGYGATGTFPTRVVPEGVVSRTFIGDGGYGVYVQKNEQGQAIAACLVFDYRLDPYADQD